MWLCPAAAASRSRLQLSRAHAQPSHDGFIHFLSRFYSFVIFPIAVTAWSYTGWHIPQHCKADSFVDDRRR
ncbi:hypothetical protein BDZ45DRAFT_394742 [Acephala macrosclerotiorum]|nr:hypothetical protein BDZ45DRAFT_394742 [Acephala macrosclerotiorum]